MARLAEQDFVNIRVCLFGLRSDREVPEICASTCAHAFCELLGPSESTSTLLVQGFVSAPRLTQRDWQRRHRPVDTG
jgi:hypothetical protein